MKSILVKNDGYKWTFCEGSAFKGYMIDDKTGEVYRGTDAIDILKKAYDFEELKTRISNVDGSFSFIIRKGENIWAGVDIARSMPLFFTLDFEYISDSLKEIVKVKKFLRTDLESSAVEEYVKSYYIGHNRTLYKTVRQLDAGQVAEFTDSSSNVEYYYLHRTPIRNCSRVDALSEFTEISASVMRDVLKIAGNRPIVISLSGGYDSRYVACMLKFVGAKDVSCYSYGKRDSFEVKKAKEIAEKLGFRWIFVDYSDEKMKKYFTGEYIDFFDAYEGMDSVPYIQNYIAVKYLEEQGYFKPNSVFVTGLCNDMQTGAYTKMESELGDFSPSKEYLLQHIISRRNLNNSLGNNALHEYQKVLEDVVNKMQIKVNSYQEFVSAAESIEAILLHSRVFLHMNDIHALMGYEWIIPCWNKKLLSYWYSMPVEYRARQNLYEEWQMTSIPLEYGVAQKKVRISYTLYTGLDKFKGRLRLIAKRLLFYPLGKNINEDIDYNNFNYVSAKYFKNIKEKSAFGFRNLSTNQILGFYTAEHWLGKDMYKAIVRKYEK